MTDHIMEGVVTEGDKEVKIKYEGLIPYYNIVYRGLRSTRGL